MPPFTRGQVEWLRDLIDQRSCAIRHPHYPDNEIIVVRDADAEMLRNCEDLAEALSDALDAAEAAEATAEPEYETDPF